MSATGEPWPARRAALARAAEAAEEPPRPPRPTAALEAADEALARELDEQLNRNLRRSASPSPAAAVPDPTTGARPVAAAAAGSRKQAPTGAGAGGSRSRSEGVIGGGGIGGGVQPPGYVGAYGSAADYEDVEWEEGGPPEGRDAAMSEADAAAVAAVLAEDEQHGEEAAGDVMDLDPTAAMRWDPHGEGGVLRGALRLRGHSGPVGQPVVGLAGGRKAGHRISGYQQVISAIIYVYVWGVFVPSHAPELLTLGTRQPSPGLYA